MAATITTKDEAYTSANGNLSVSKYMHEYDGIIWSVSEQGHHIKYLRVILIHVWMTYKVIDKSHA